ncbi:MAG: permease-like cell division protein FtsX [Elusimicrobiales bacterium]|nr:permease-like cell division protein FtsX [Elusimicrobiales bacterium]
MSLLNKKGYRIVFLATFIFGIYIETIIFFYFQTREINDLLINDFKVVVALKKNIDKTKIIDSLSVIKGVGKVDYFTSDDMLKKLDSEDKELSLSIRSMPVNPVPDIVEISPTQTVLGNIDGIVEEISKLDGIMDIRYKPDELVAIMHTLFYSKFLFLIIGLSLLTMVVIFFSGIYHVGVNNFFSSLKESLKWFINGILGVLTAMLCVYLIIYPIKYISAVWYWPSVVWHLFALISGGVMGWVLYQWKKN